MGSVWLRRVGPSASFSLYRLITTTANGEVQGVEKWFTFRKAIVSTVPKSFRNAIGKETDRVIDVAKARQQHEYYVEQLKKLVDVVQFQCSEQFPDGVYVEDPAVVLQNKAVITRIDHKSREGETAHMKRLLERMGMEIHEIENIDPEATLDGGDVLFTGREFFVGLSHRTNERGVKAFSRVFPEWPVAAVPISGTGALHLKSTCSMAGVDLVAIGDTPAGHAIWKVIESEGSHKYERLAFPDDNAANCIFINGTILHCSREDYPNSMHVWESIRDVPRVEVPNSEHIKADAALTCSSIRIN